MAHFVELDSANIVIRGLVVPDEQEHRGEEYLADEIGLGGRWIQTSYNATIRGKFAGIGDFYDEALDIFVEPQPYSSWIQNGSFWKAPKDKPETGHYYWDESKLDWIANDLG